MGTCFHKLAECLGRGKLHYQQTGSARCNVGDDETGDIWIDDIFDDKCLVKIAKPCFTYYSSISPFTWTDKDLISIIKWANELVSFQDGAFDPRKRTIFAIEHFFDFEIKQEWAKYSYDIDNKQIEGYLSLKGTVDLIEEVDENTIEVCDYKTGKKPFNWATGQDKGLKDFQKDPQLLIYYYALKNRYPDKNILFTVYYIKTGQPFTVCFDEDDYKKAEKLIQKRFEEIKKNNYPTLISQTQEKREKNFKCSKLCHFHKNNWEGTDKSICHFMQDQVLDIGADSVMEKFGNFGKLASYGDGGGRKAEIKE